MEVSGREWKDLAVTEDELQIAVLDEVQVTRRSLQSMIVSGERGCWTDQVKDSILFDT